MLARYEECSTTGEAALKGYNALKGHSLRAETVKELVKEISSAPSTTLNAVTLGWALWEWEKKVVNTPLPSKGQTISPKVAP